MSVQLYRSSVEDRVEKIKDRYNDDTHESFLRLAFYLVTGLGYDDLEPEDIVDGHGEYQIDAFHIDTSRREDQAIVTIIQVTYSESLSSTKLIKLHAGLDYLLVQPKSVYSALSNSSLRDKIQEFRDLRSEILPASIKLQCYYVALGDPAKAAGEFPEQIERIRSDYSSSVGDFSFDVLGLAQIFELLNQRERRAAKVNDRLKIIFDQNKANLLEHSIEGVSGVICTVQAEEIARVVNEHPTVFDENLRRFLGLRGGVNEKIHESCTAEDIATLFWFLNNGITIVCDDYDVNKDYDNPLIEINNLRIVNGCQTATSIAMAKAGNLLQPSTKVLVRIFKTKSADLASKLVITTNTQNKITSRDLHAQDEIQEHIQAEFERRFGIKYERTPNEFADLSRSDSQEIVSNQKIGQSYLAVVRKRPSDASRRQYKVWGDQYDYRHIFNASIFPETYLLTYRIVEYCNARKRQTLAELDDADVKRILVANGTYHLARIISFLWRRGDDWNDLEQIRRDLQKLKDEPDLLAVYYDEALKLLVEVFNSDEQFIQDPSVALKSSKLDDEISNSLYRKRARSTKRTKSKPKK